MPFLTKNICHWLARNEKDLIFHSQKKIRLLSHSFCTNSLETDSAHINGKSKWVAYGSKST